MQEKFLSYEHSDVIGEIGNITFGSGSTALGLMLNQPIDISTPKIEVINRNELSKFFTDPFVLVEIEYAEGLEGHNILLLKPQDALVIADLMMGNDGTSVDRETTISEFEMSAVQEAMNQMMGSASTAMSDFLHRTIDINPPNTALVEKDVDKILSELFTDEQLVYVRFRLSIGDLIQSDLVQIINKSFALELADSVLKI